MEATQERADPDADTQRQHDEVKNFLTGQWVDELEYRQAFRKQTQVTITQIIGKNTEQIKCQRQKGRSKRRGANKRKWEQVCR